MKVRLVGNYAPDRQISMDLFPRMLGQALESRGIETLTIKPRVRIGRRTGASRGCGKWLGYVDKLVLFPADLRALAGDFDLVHVCDHSNSPYTRVLQGIPHVVTCHDVLAICSARGEIPQNPTRWSGRQLQRLIARGLERARHVVCVSEATRTRLLRVTGRDPAHTSVVPSATNHPYRPLDTAEARTRLGELLPLKAPYILHVGADAWYKNRTGAVRIFAALVQKPGFEQLRLVMASPAPNPAIAQQACALGVSERVHEISGASAEQLEGLYSGAEALLFPSLAEGFGWPVLEAMACGCPVVTSNRPPMTEVAGDAAIYIDPEQPESAAQLIATAWDERPRLRRRGLERAAAFSTESMAAGYESVYERVVAA